MPRHDTNKNIVDISQEPYNTRPILNALTQIIDKKTRQDHNKPLILLMGEDHDLVTSQILQLCTLAILKGKGQRVAYGLEYPDNTLISMKDHFNDLVRGKFAEQTLWDRFWQDENIKSSFDMRALMMLMNHDKYHYRARFCYDNGISCAFNDAAISATSEFLLDTTDPHVKEALNDLEYQGFKTYPRSRPDAVHARNLIIARNIQRHINALENKPDIYVQMLGGFHVLGQSSTDHKTHFPYHESVKETLKEMGYDVISLTFDMHDVSIPEDACLNDTLIVKGWDKDRMNGTFEEELKRTSYYVQELLPEFEHTTKADSQKFSIELYQQVVERLKTYPSLPKLAV